MWRRRTAANRAGVADATGTPATLTRPLVGVRMQPRIESSVVLPEPDGPSSATISPAAMASETPRTASTACTPSPYRLHTSWATMAGSAGADATAEATVACPSTVDGKGGGGAVMDMPGGGWESGAEDERG